MLLNDIEIYGRAFKMQKKMISLFLAIILCFTLSTSVFAGRPVDQKTETFERTIYDDKLWWIKGYTTIDYVRGTGKITKTTARSALLGLTAGLTWDPAEPRITVLSDFKRQVIFAGTLSALLRTINVEGKMIVQSVPLIEGPCRTCHSR